jgi:hypothetical protein
MAVEQAASKATSTPSAAARHPCALPKARSKLVRIRSWSPKNRDTVHLPDRPDGL